MERVMGLFFNEHEVEQMADRASRNPELAPFGRIAVKYVEIINSNSDGWPYWAAGSNAASKFLEKLDKLTNPYRRDGNEPKPTIADLKKAMAPMKALLTKRKLPALPPL
jgi:hypothetical protein